MLNNRKCHALIRPIVKEMGEKYNLEAYKQFPGVYYLRRENENYFLRIGFSNNYYYQINHINIFAILLQNWIVKVNKRFHEFILPELEPDDMYIANWDFNRFGSQIFIHDWFQFSEKNIKKNFYLEIQDESEIQQFSDAFESMIRDYSLPLIEQTRDLRTMGNYLVGLEPLEILNKLKGGFLYNTNSLLIMTLLGIEGKNEIVDFIIEQKLAYIRRHGDDKGIWTGRIKVYKKMVLLLENKKVVDSLMSVLDESGTMVSMSTEKKYTTLDESENDEEEIYAEPPESMLDYMIILDMNIQEKIDDIKLCLEDGNYNNKEEAYLGELFEGNQHIYIGGTGDYTVIALPLEKLEVFDSEYLTDIEECLIKMFPTIKILTIHMNKVYSIYYRLISDKKLLSSGLYGIDGTYYIEGELTEEEQQLVSKEEQKYDKISTLWHYHFDKMTGMESPFTMEFGKLKMKEI